MRLKLYAFSVGLILSFITSSIPSNASEDSLESPHANGASTFTEEFQITGPQVDHSERSKHLCFRLARKGNFVKLETIDAPWHESGGTYTYRYTEFKSGMQCKELIEGRNTRQWGNVKKESCWCSGKLDIIQ
jgi:hypothetical protein